MLSWKLRKRQILPVNQNLSSVYFQLAKFQLVSCNLSLAMIWQMTYIHKLPKLCSATLKTRHFPFTGSFQLWKFIFELSIIESRSDIFPFAFSTSEPVMNFKICYWSKSEISYKIVESTYESRNRGDLVTASEYGEFFLVLRGSQTTYLPPRKFVVPDWLWNLQRLFRSER